MKQSDEVERPSQSQPQDDGDPPSEQEQSRAGVSFMITQQQKAALIERGYTADEIRQMKPEDAHRALGLIELASDPGRSMRGASEGALEGRSSTRRALGGTGNRCRRLKGRQ
jgi:hypothetical protein